MQTAPDASLAEVALHAGFSDQSQFSHHFKRFIGVTPGEFRRQNMKGSWTRAGKLRLPAGCDATP
jgi:AraC-like DNA-binding protein